MNVFNNENYPEFYIQLILMLSSYYNNLALIMDDKSKRKKYLELSIKYSIEIIGLTNSENNLFKFSLAHYNLGCCYASLCLMEGKKNDHNYKEAKRCLQLVLDLVKDNRLRIHENARIHLDKLSNMYTAPHYEPSRNKLVRYLEKGIRRGSCEAKEMGL